MNIMNPMKTKTSKTGALLLALGGMFLAGCGLGGILEPRPPKDTQVDWDWKMLPSFSTEAVNGDKVFVEFNDAPVVPDLCGTLKQDLIKVLKEKHGLDVVQDSKDAKYIVRLNLRYFDGNKAADRGASIEAKAGDIAGGRDGWIIPGQGPSSFKEVPGVPNLSAGSWKEWVLLLDVAVGEKGGDSTWPEGYALRTGRLIGSLPLRGLDRQDVTWYFKYGKPYPRPPEPSDDPNAIPASWTPPDPAQPATFLLNALIPRVLPLVN